MATRKDMMRVLRRDTEFAARLEFGQAGPGEPGPQVDRPGTDRADNAPTSPVESGSPESEPGAPTASAPTAKTKGKGASSGIRVYVAISLTPEQAARAEVWARKARCTVPFLIRKLCQSVRKDAYARWAQHQVNRSGEPRVKRGCYPTSITLTLPADLARDLTQVFDPMGLLGLARLVGPSFRAQFDAHFEVTATRAGF